MSSFSRAAKAAGRKKAPLRAKPAHSRPKKKLKPRAFEKAMLLAVAPGSRLLALEAFGPASEEYVASGEAPPIPLPPEVAHGRVYVWQGHAQLDVFGGKPSLVGDWRQLTEEEWTRIMRGRRVLPTRTPEPLAAASR